MVAIMPALSSALLSPFSKSISKEAPAIHILVKLEQEVQGISETSFKAHLPEARIKRPKHFVIIPVVVEERFLRRISSEDVIIHCSNKVFSKAEKEGFINPFPVELRIRACRSGGTITVL